jgi:hypothetical protein
MVPFPALRAAGDDTEMGDGKNPRATASLDQRRTSKMLVTYGCRAPAPWMPRRVGLLMAVKRIGK